VPIKGALSAPHSAPRRHLLVEIGEGMRWVWRQHLIRALVALIAGSNLIFAALTLTIIVRVRDLGGSPAATGLVLGMFGVGALTGALAAPAVQRRVPANVVMIGAPWAWAVQLLLLTVTPNLVLIAVVCAIGTLFGPVFNVVVAAYRYALIPDRLQGRTTGVLRLVAWGTIPIGSLAGGLSVERFGAVSTLAGLAVLGVMAAIAGTATPHVRRVPPLETLEQVS
jgi:predicted MFS family arabinose efflux permease